jgi:hypothetical protein
VAINLRIPEDLDRALELVAEREHVSKHSLLLQGAQLIVDRASRREEIASGLEYVLTHDAEFLQRLADA